MPNAPLTTPQTDQNVALDHPWSVIVYDDPVNLMDYVTKVIQNIFGYPSAKAETMMHEVHNNGRSVVWSGEKERAELYVQQLQEAQLTAGMEQSES